MKISELFTRSNAEETKPMEVVSIDGSKTGLYMQVRGSECTDFLQARREYMRRRLSPNAEGEDPILSSEMEYARLVAVLVESWDFEEPCEFKNKVELLYQSPYLTVQIENFANFQGNKSREAFDNAKTNSSTGPEEASS